MQKIFFKIMNINNFQGDLTDISAEKEALLDRAKMTVTMLWWQCFLFSRNIG